MCLGYFYPEKKGGYEPESVNRLQDAEHIAIITENFFQLNREEAMRKKNTTANAINQATKTDTDGSMMTRKIGSTTYRVKIHYDDTGPGSMEDALLRMIRNETETGNQDSTNPEVRVMMESPQMSRPA